MEALVHAHVHTQYIKRFTFRIFVIRIHVSISVSGLSTVEAYNYKANEWVYVASMNTRRSSVGVGVVDGKTETPGPAFSFIIHGPN